MSTTLTQPQLVNDGPTFATSTPQTITLRQLRKHTAHDRTQYDLDKIAGLTLQIYQRNIDTWQPIVAAPLPAANSDEPTFAIISGHRRYFARIFVHAVHEWAALDENKEVVAEGITLDFVRSLIEEILAKLGGVETAAAQLLQMYGDQEIAIVSFTGTLKEQILALQAANFGSEEPDTLGRAHSFQAAIDAGATSDEIARNAGVNVHYVLNHLALAAVHPQLAQRITQGELPMSVARIVGDLPTTQSEGLTSFILANPGDKLTVKQLKRTAKQLANWSGLQLPLTGYANQAQRNIARCLAHLWQKALQVDPAAAWGATAVLAYQDALQGEPWTNPDRVYQWLQLFGGHDYVSASGNINWQAVLTELLPQLACATCPIAQLPPPTLRTELGEGRDGPLGMPCRLPHENGNQPTIPCLHGLLPNDPFTVRVPWEWAEHPGVVSQNGGYSASSLPDLQTAWQHQAQLEAAEDAESQTSIDTSGTTISEETAASTAVTMLPTLPEQNQSDNGVSVAQSAEPPNEDAAPSPIQIMRARIHDFMSNHGRLNATHPFATPCKGCRHKLDSSPTKDATVPHCAWARRLRKVDFRQIAIDDAGFTAVPVCRQYAPTPSWVQIIPAYPHPVTMPRDWITRQILNLVKQGQRQATNYNANGIQRSMFEWLTGRPMSSSEKHQDWFAEQFQQHQGSLSDAQLWTLFIYSLAELDRVQQTPFALPLDSTAAQFLEAHDLPFTVPKPANSER